MPIITLAFRKTLSIFCLLVTLFGAPLVAPIPSAEMSTPAVAITNSHQSLIIEPCNEHSIDKRRQLIKSLRGSKVIIPDLQQLMNHWPAGVNDRIQELHGIVEQQLET